MFDDGYGIPVRLVARRRNLEPLRKGGVDVFAVAPRAVRHKQHRDGSVEGSFRIGDYVCRFAKAAHTPGVVTMEGGGLPMAFHLVANDWSSALSYASSAARRFLAGLAPERGLFRHLEKAEQLGMFHHDYDN